MSRVLRLGSVIAAFLAMASASGAQTATGQITGSVRDSSGAVMPKVKVVVTNQQTGLTRETTTNDLGDYVVPLLPVGVYLVTAEQNGFKMAVRSDRAAQRRSGPACRPSARCRQRFGEGRSEVVRRRARHRERDRRPDDHREAGHRTAAERPQLPAAAVPRRRRRRDRRRAGRHAAGRRQRDQHHGRAADLEQLHDRRHVEHRHGAGHARRRAVGRRHPGIQGADDDLLRGVRLQLQPDQHRQQDRHERVPRDGLRLHPQRKTGRAGTSSIRRMPTNPNSIRSNSGSSSAVRSCCRSTTGATRRSSWSTTKGRGSSAGFSSFYTVPTPDQLAGRFTTHDHRPADRAAVPEQHHSPVALFTPRAARVEKRLVPGAEQQRRAGQLSSCPNAAPECQDQFTIRGDQDLGKLGRVFGRYHEDDVRQHARTRTCWTSATASSCRTRRTGRCPTPGRSGATS